MICHHKTTFLIVVINLLALSQSDTNTNTTTCTNIQWSQFSGTISKGGTQIFNSITTTTAYNNNNNDNNNNINNNTNNNNINNNDDNNNTTTVPSDINATTTSPLTTPTTTTLDNTTTNNNTTTSSPLLTSFTSDQCMHACEVDNRCLAVDYDLYYGACWVHYDQNYLDNVQSNQSYNQFRLSRNCTTDQSDTSYFNKCFPTFKMTSQNTVGTPSTPLNFTTPYSCFEYCRNNPACNAVVFDDSVLKKCSMVEDVSMSVSSDTSTIYEFNKTNDCPKSPNKQQMIIRCAGQNFPPTSQWCPPGTNISIVNKFFKYHPFCCPESFDPNIFPLDSSSLIALAVSRLDPDYSKTIDDCLKVSDCFITARSMNSSMDYGLCPADKSLLDSLNVIYKCIDPNAVQTVPPLLTTVFHPTVDTSSSPSLSSSSSSSSPSPPSSSSPSSSSPNDTSSLSTLLPEPTPSSPSSSSNEISSTPQFFSPPSSTSSPSQSSPPSTSSPPSPSQSSTPLSIPPPSSSSSFQTPIDPQLTSLPTFQPTPTIQQPTIQPTTTNHNPIDVTTIVTSHPPIPTSSMDTHLSTIPPTIFVTQTMVTTSTPPLISTSTRTLAPSSFVQPSVFNTATTTATTTTSGGSGGGGGGGGGGGSSGGGGGSGGGDGSSSSSSSDNSMAYSALVLGAIGVAFGSLFLLILLCLLAFCIYKYILNRRAGYTNKDLMNAMYNPNHNFIGTSSV